MGGWGRGVKMWVWCGSGMGMGVKVEVWWGGVWGWGVKGGGVVGCGGRG